MLPPVTNVDAIYSEILKDFFVDKDTLVTILAHLVAKKNILLIGPVGSGKTHLAKHLPQIAWKDHSNGYYAKVYTATADWTTQDVVGGIYPKINKKGRSQKITYALQYGCVSETVKDNKPDNRDRLIDSKRYRGVWLVIDEFNRANIDRAFGQLFTALEYGKLKIPTVDSNEPYETLHIPEDYRIIGTLNTADRHFLHTLSDALKRRFAIVEIRPPTDRRLELVYVLRKFWKDKRGGLDMQAQDTITKEAAEILKHVSVTEIKNAIQIGDPQKTAKIVKEIEDTIENNSDRGRYMMWRSILGLCKILSYIRSNKPLGTELLISMLRFMLTRQFMINSWEKSMDMALETIVLPQLESLPYQTLEVMHAVLGGKDEKSTLRNLIKKTDIEYKSAVKHLFDHAGKKVVQASPDETTYINNWVSKWREGISGQITLFCSGIDSIIREQNPYYREEE